ncbi:MAG: hypothetical protein J5528_02115 [Firmicutes bacterium]|nr:hypothetical protein [Bacillota bacterium]
MRVYDIDAKLKDYRYLDWTESGISSGTSGSLLKTKEQKNGKTYFYKLSSYDPYRGVFGSESVNELVACRLLNLLGIEHLQYKLIHALVDIRGEEYETWLVRSVNFREIDERKIALDTYYDMNRFPKEDPLAFCRRMGWEKYIYKMFLADFLIANRDRHGANLEVLGGKHGELRLAPLFDNGLSFLAPLAGDEQRIKDFEPLSDVRSNNFIGTGSLKKNLEMIGEFPDVDPVFDNSREELFAGLDKVLPEYHLDKMWQIIIERWRYYENFCDQKSKT